ncbi:MAG: ACP S-malonyltransferase [Gammaproteobacteria bacterium]|nr:ACP S-malonyltransferase [Gammaproteobacteria bacterium]
MKFAFVFPGQGSQSVGMMADFYSAFPEVKATFDEANEALGYDLWDLVQNGPEEKLNQTEFTQPAVLTAGVAMYRAFTASCDLQPAMMAGHSLGEYAALVCAGSMSLADGVQLVAERGRLMQQAVPEGEGAMAAILGLDDETLINICAQVDGVVQAVNFNSPGQVVIAGETAAVNAAIELCKEAKAKRALPLPVSVPSHSSLMKGAADKLADRLLVTELSMPSVPVFHNVTALATGSVDAMKAALKEQLYNPVLWVDTVNNLIDAGVEATVECGPGKVLSGLNKRINKAIPSLALVSPEGMQKVIEDLKA